MDNLRQLHGICVKLYATTDALDRSIDALLVPIFHEWIREHALDLVAIDVADYSHVPASPGMMLVTHDIAFSLDRADGRLGLLAQRRRPTSDATEPIAETLRHALAVAEKLEHEPRLAGRLRFEKRRARIEANDRLRAPNTDAAFERFAPVAGGGASRVFGDVVVVRRVVNDPRDRLAVQVEA